MIYLDNSSTTKQADSVTKLMAEIAEERWGNPSSLHALGIRSEKHLETARKNVAALLGASQDQVFFTSGGTEGDVMILTGVMRARKRERRKLIVSAVEHPAVLETAAALERDGFEVVRIGVDRMCRIDMDALKDAIDEDTALVSVMAVNNETGTIMPVREIANAAHAKGAYFHTDAVQALGKEDLKATGADLITVSSHKIHGPMGVGGVFVGKGVKILPLIPGGGQEKGMRSGTENVPGIAGFGEAARLAAENFEGHRRHFKEIHERLRDNIESSIRDIVVNSPDDGTHAVLNVSFMGTRGEVLLHTLEQEGIYVSTGSACSSNKKGQSHVLTAMGLSGKEIEGAIRFSLSRYNTLEEMDIAADAVRRAVTRFRKLGSFR